MGTGKHRKELEQFDTQTLDAMLHDELRKDYPDGDFVREILRIAEEREKGIPVICNPQLEKECERFMNEEHDNKRKAVFYHGWFLKAASVVLILGMLLITVSQEVEADGFFQRVMRWTDSVFELFNPQHPASNEEYAFITDHPGLQQVYDECVKLGITDPVVPMWIPEEYVLEECKLYINPAKNGLIAEFSSDTDRFMYKVDVYSNNSNYEYYKNDPIEEIEIHGQKYSILQNEDAWVVVWFREEIECSIYVNCQEDILHRILRSIYILEDLQ